MLPGELFLEALEDLPRKLSPGEDRKGEDEGSQADCFSVKYESRLLPEKQWVWGAEGLSGETGRLRKVSEPGKVSFLRKGVERIGTGM